MTGGQMAPTTLVGQRSTTSPWGRRPVNEGFPLHMAEMLSSLEAPVYIERVALSDNKNIMKARRAVRKALELQRDGAGFTFVEILSPCPTIWGKDPIEARKWIGEKMIPNFPLNVFRDKKIEIPNTNVPPHKTVEEIVEGERKVARESMIRGRSHHFQHTFIAVSDERHSVSSSSAPIMTTLATFAEPSLSAISEAGMQTTCAFGMLKSSGNLSRP
jgi:2-oxoisovalerate ferredoxin oxidoreductase beta subunit